MAAAVTATNAKMAEAGAGAGQAVPVHMPQGTERTCVTERCHGGCRASTDVRWTARRLPVGWDPRRCLRGSLVSLAYRSSG
jgi:hypothetical protein